jgi:16S rRNA (adenine1518-N6/adenine1519-N6)-dimethyltransferase
MPRKSQQHDKHHTPRKRFGQNFLHHPGVIQRIVNTIAPQPDEHVVEIGPGKGALTRPLLRTTGSLDVVELDRDLIEPLREMCRGLGELTIYNADALQFDFTGLLRNNRKLRVVGNLPYNISTPLLFHLLEQAGAIHDMHFMLQKEVVERMAAVPGGADYGRLSVMLQYRCRVERLFTVKPGAFTPAPKVDSAVVRLVPHAAPPVKVSDETVFAAIVRQAFSQRRKTLRNTLRGLLTETQLIALGIDPGLRAQTLSLEHYALLSNAVDRSSMHF